MIADQAEQARRFFGAPKKSMNNDPGRENSAAGLNASFGIAGREDLCETAGRMTPVLLPPADPVEVHLMVGPLTRT